MKKCQKCGYENVETMRFCLECGTPLADAPMIINLSDKPTESLSGGAPTNFGSRRETETFVAGRGEMPGNFGNFAAPPAPNKAKSNKKLFLILGGVVALFGLLGVAGAAIVYYNYKQKAIVTVSPTPTASPTATVSKSPTPKTSVSPSASPSVSPEKTPEATFTPPIEATKKGTFTVHANDGWQLSDIDVVSLEQFRTSVSGAIDLSGIKASVAPGGVIDAKTKSRRIYPEFPTGAILMRTRYADGKTSNTVSMTTNGANGTWQNYPNETGKLEFCINDNAPQSNGGQFIVSVSMTSVPKAKK